MKETIDNSRDMHQCQPTVRDLVEAQLALPFALLPPVLFIATISGSSPHTPIFPYCPWIVTTQYDFIDNTISNVLQGQYGQHFTVPEAHAISLRCALEKFHRNYYRPLYHA